MFASFPRARRRLGILTSSGCSGIFRVRVSSCAFWSALAVAPAACVQQRRFGEDGHRLTDRVSRRFKRGRWDPVLESAAFRLDSSALSGSAI